MASRIFGANRPNINSVVSGNLTEGMSLRITPSAKEEILRCDHAHHSLRAHTFGSCPMVAYYSEKHWLLIYSRQANIPRYK